MSTHRTKTAGRGSTASDSRSRRRTQATRVIAWFMASSALLFGAFTAVFGVVAEGQLIHAFHNAIVASLLLVLSAPPALVIARNPDRSDSPLKILTALSGAAVITMAAAVTVDPFTLPFVVFTGVLWVLRPPQLPRANDGQPSLLLFGLVAIAVVPLVAYALGQAELQRTLAENEHSRFFHWVETSFYAAGILALGLLGAFRPFAYRMAAWSAGIGVIVLGGASLILSSYASAVPLPWPWLAIAGGIAFVAVAEWEVTRQRNLDLKESGGTRRHRSEGATTSVAALSPSGPDLDSDL